MPKSREQAQAEKAARARARRAAKKDGTTANKRTARKQKLPDPGDVEVELNKPKQARRKVANQARKPSAKSRARQPPPSQDAEDTKVVGVRGCHGRNLYNEPCGGMAVRKGKKVTDLEGKEYEASGGWCMMHDPALPPYSKMHTGNAGKRQSNMRPMELAQRIMEDAVGHILDPYLKTLGLRINPDTGQAEKDPDNDGAVLFGTSKDGEVIASDLVDLGAQIKAAELMMDRVYGRAKQATEVTGGDGGPLVIEVPWNAERAKAVGDVLRQVGALPKEKK